MAKQDYTTLPKCCTQCKQEYPDTYEFYSKSNGYVSKRCRACIRESKREVQLATRDAAVAIGIDVPDKVWNARWSTDDERLQRQRESSRKYGKRDRQEHPEKYRFYQRRRMSVKKKALCTFTVADEATARQYFNGQCAACGRDVTTAIGLAIAMDHWIPMSKGGHTALDNMIPLCHGLGGCNNTKSNKEAAVWLISAFGADKAVEVLKRVNAYFEWVKSNLTKPNEP